MSTKAEQAPKIGDRFQFVTSVGGPGFEYQRGQVVALGTHYLADEVPEAHGRQWIEGGVLIAEGEPLPMPREAQVSA